VVYVTLGPLRLLFGWVGIVYLGQGLG